MHACHEQARLAKPICAPNPAVGAVLVDTRGVIIGTGHTQSVGGPHAEIVALRQAAESGSDARGATLYVSLEPCAHHGRTGPCCEAIITAGITRVIASCEDPNPLVAGKGFEWLRSAGIEVNIGEGAAQTQELNIGFFSRMIRKTPWMRMKMASSLDGATALAKGQSKWLTSEAARADGRMWRARAGCVLTGIGTILADNPRLDVRPDDGLHQPMLAIVDSNLQTPPDAALFTARRPVVIFASMPDEARQRRLEQCGAAVVYCPAVGETDVGRVNLRDALENLASREINELHVEAGHTLNGGLLRERLVDELLVYLAPKLIGPGLPMAHLDALMDVNAGHELKFQSSAFIGPDLRIIARVRDRGDFLMSSNV